MELDILKENLPVLSDTAIEMESSTVHVGMAWLTKANAGDYYEVAVYRFDDRGALLLVPVDIAKYDAIVLNESNINGYHAEKRQIEINCCDRIGIIKLKFIMEKHFDRTQEILVEMKR